MKIETLPAIEELYRYNDWANQRLFELCYGLSNAELDQPRELGPGSLRNTLFHILAAEQIWLERWQVAPWRSFSTDSLGQSVESIEAELRQVSQARQQMMKSERDSQWQRVVNYKDGSGKPHSNPLNVLLLHVANHSVYHRAQVLAYLKPLGRTLPVGIDYICYKVARPSLELPSESIKRFQELGLQVNKAPGWIPAWDGLMFERYVEYGQWANRQIFDLLADADHAILERDHGFGHGSILKTWQHLLTVESYWSAILDQRADQWQRPTECSLDEVNQQISRLQVERAAFVKGLDNARAQQTVSFAPAGIPLQVRVIEALMQLCSHATHHRAQLVNMLRHSGLKMPASDLIVWWRQLA